MARLSNRRRRELATAVEREFGADTLSGRALMQVLFPKPLSEAEVVRAVQARVRAEGRKKAKQSLRREWDEMSWTEYAERKAAGTLPPTK
jgi:hypothetical protein